VGEGDGILDVPLPSIRLSRRHPSFESLSTSKTFVPIKIGDLMGGVCTCLLFVGKKSHLLVFLRGKALAF
jgi:hypothetical protein